MNVKERTWKQISVLLCAYPTHTETKETFNTNFKVPEKSAFHRLKNIC